MLTFGWGGQIFLTLLLSATHFIQPHEVSLLLDTMGSSTYTPIKFTVFTLWDWVINKKNRDSSTPIPEAKHLSDRKGQSSRIERLTLDSWQNCVLVLLEYKGFLFFIFIIIFFYFFIFWLETKFLHNFVRQSWRISKDVSSRISLIYFYQS